MDILQLHYRSAYDLSMNVFNREHQITASLLLLVALLSYFTHFDGYAEPDGLFWDENYHIPAAQKYLDGILFMEYHPPLGKLLIALGEHCFGSNQQLQLDELRSSSYIKGLPDGYSYEGVRFFPALFGWLSVPLFFLLMLKLSGHRAAALLFTTPFLFENGLIVHFRGAMLDGFLVCFMLLTLYVWLSLLHSRNAVGLLQYFILGLCIGCAVSVKITGGILLFLPLFLAAAKHWSPADPLAFIGKAAAAGCSVALGAVIPFIAVWYVHFGLGTEVFANKLYQASPEYQRVVREGETWNPSNFRLMLRDTLRFFAYENRGVPKLDVCKPGENGSYPTSWMVGSKAINYRWTKQPEGVSYLYLVLNPVVLVLSLAALLFSVIMIGARCCYGVRSNDEALFTTVAAMTVMYVCYMLVMLQLDRVMYLYHYFPPYTFMLVAGAALFLNAFGGQLRSGDRIVWAALLLMAVNVYAAYEFFSPLSYYEPLNLQEFNRRMWFGPWGLEPIT